MQASATPVQATPITSPRGRPFQRGQPAPKNTGRKPRRGPYSREWENRALGGGPPSWLDGRTKEAAVFKSVQDEFTKHCGGNPTAAERAIIERCAWLSVRLNFLDRKLAKSQEFTIADSNYYLAWSNSLCRAIRSLGLQPPHNLNKPRHADVLAEVSGDG